MQCTEPDVITCSCSAALAGLRHFLHFLLHGEEQALVRNIPDSHLASFPQQNDAAIGRLGLQRRSEAHVLVGRYSQLKATEASVAEFIPQQVETMGNVDSNEYNHNAKNKC